MIELEQSIRDEGYDHVIGIDEAGRGPLAGPVVAGAVLIKDYGFTATIRDSKKISQRQREKAFHEILEKAHVGVGIINEAVIDQINILEATYLAMHNAIAKVTAAVSRSGTYHNGCLLIDGKAFKTHLSMPYRTVVSGDNKVFSIACASIVAKVIRDRILTVYDRVYPQYGFAQHKGYGTVKHRTALTAHGLSQIHRKSFIHL